MPRVQRAIYGVEVYAFAVTRETSQLAEIHGHP
jgi:hypothetical protein